jgi:release factor glutamine methyltransferase
VTASVRQLLDEAIGALTAAGVASPRVDAELLLAHCVGGPRARLLGHGPVTAEQAPRFRELVARRAAREPLQHLVGTAAFRFVEVAVGPGVFVPRPESELLVDAVLAHLARSDAPVVVDLCAGSGALALSIAHEVPRAKVVAVESDPDALDWLRRNTSGTDVEVVAADVHEPATLSDYRGRVDVVVSNPPYVPTSTRVAAEVAHDPYGAVFAGADGLAVIAAVIARAAGLLRPRGALALEHDDTHAEIVPALLRASGDWVEIADHRDLTGRPRYVTSVRTGPSRPGDKMAG